MNQSVRNAFMIAVRAKLEEAEKLFNVDFSNVDIKLNIRGNRIAGEALTETRFPYKSTLRFHPDAVEKYLHNMIHDIVPHEVAHLVCHHRPDLGRNHDRGWKMVAKKLGCSGNRCHEMKFGKHTVYVYRSTKGNEIELSKIRHNRVQRGTVYLVQGDRQNQILASGFVKEKV